MSLYLGKDKINNLSIGQSSSGPDTSDATATADDIALNKTAYVNGEKITGTIGEISSSEYNQKTGSLSNYVKKNGTNCQVSYPFNTPKLCRSGAQVRVQFPMNNFGDATAADVASGKTFTSASGFKLAGTLQQGASWETIDDDKDIKCNYLTFSDGYWYGVFDLSDTTDGTIARCARIDANLSWWTEVGTVPMGSTVQRIIAKNDRVYWFTPGYWYSSNVFENTINQGTIEEQFNPKNLFTKGNGICNGVDDFSYWIDSETALVDGKFGCFCYSDSTNSMSLETLNCHWSLSEFDNNQYNITTEQFPIGNIGDKVDYLYNGTDMYVYFINNYNYDYTLPILITFYNRFVGEEPKILGSGSYVTDGKVTYFNEYADECIIRFGTDDFIIIDKYAFFNKTFTDITDYALNTFINYNNTEEPIIVGNKLIQLNESQWFIHYTNLDNGEEEEETIDVADDNEGEEPLSNLAYGNGYLAAIQCGHIVFKKF